MKSFSSFLPGKHVGSQVAEPHLLEQDCHSSKFPPVKLILSLVPPNLRPCMHTTNPDVQFTGEQRVTRKEEKAARGINSFRESH